MRIVKRILDYPLAPSIEILTLESDLWLEYCSLHTQIRWPFASIYPWPNLCSCLDFSWSMYMFNIHRYFNNLTNCHQSGYQEEPAWLKGTSVLQLLTGSSTCSSNSTRNNSSISSGISCSTSARNISSYSSTSSSISSNTSTRSISSSSKSGSSGSSSRCNNSNNRSRSDSKLSRKLVDNSLLYRQ